MTARPLVSALVVDPLAVERAFAGSALEAAGFQVTASETFALAKARMAAGAPTVLVTAVCLVEYNGIHLVIRGMAANQQLAAVVTSDYEDPVLRDSAEKLGATFVVKPVSAKDLVAAVMRTLGRRESDRIPIRQPFERRIADRRSSGGAVPPGVERRHADRRLGLAGLHSVN